MTGQTLLDYMELLNQELQNQPGEVNVTRSLLALNVAQDYFESLAAVRPKIMGSTTGTVVTSTVEYTTFPPGVLRIDRLQLLNDSSVVESELYPIRRTGGHIAATSWPINIVATSSGGKPRGYFTNGLKIYWAPTPDSAYTVRYYGFAVASDISAAGTFAYPDIVALPIASFAGRLTKSGLDDAPSDLGSLAQETFGAALNTLSLFNRDGAVGLEYTEIHTT